jgi:hypothetical protein
MNIGRTPSGRIIMADRRLQVFHAVAKHLSFTRAADALFMTQPAVTFQIKQLESSTAPVCSNGGMAASR